LFLALVLATARASADDSIPRLVPMPEPTTPITASPDAGVSVGSPTDDAAVEVGTMDAPRRSTFAEVVVGNYNSVHVGPVIPNFGYMQTALRYGCRPWEDRGFFARRISFMAELTFDPITDGFGSYLVGPSVMCRFDACPDSRLSPYLQGGTGFVLNDAYRYPFQRAIGENFEFLQQVEVGLRWKLTDNLAIQSEFGLQHTSNGGLAGRNLGVNALGASIGVHWDFGCR
jgi:hypothetical protein